MEQKRLAFALVVVLGLVIQGCGKKEGETAVAEESGPAPSLQQALSAETQQKAKLAVLPKGDRNMPLENYQELTSGNQLMFLYSGISGMPVDYDKVASAYSNEYRSTNDGFKKQDVLNALKPRIESEIERAKVQRYVRHISGNSRPLDSYDFNQQGFPVNDSLVLPSSYSYFNDNSSYKISFTNGEQFKLLKVADQAKARQIEDYLGKYKELTLVAYAFAQDVDPNNMIVKAEIVKLKLLDPQGNELLVQ